MESLEIPESEPVVGRFAPSPTGPLHVGSIVAAVGSWVLARQRGGRWLVRMEDIDTPRVVPGMGEDILRTLEHLGLRWDGEILWQSRRTDAYEAVLEALFRGGHLYPCGCSRAEIARISSAPHGIGGELRYPGTCRQGLPAGKTARALRVRVPDDPVSFLDCVMGPLEERLAETCGDFVVRRADGPFAYHLAVVVDDAAQGVNQVCRGADLLSSTPRQIHLQNLLGYSVPTYCHLPVVVGPEGIKLSKRDNAVSVRTDGDLRRSSGLVAAALTFLGNPPPASLIGASPGELLGWAITEFRLENIPRKPATFPPL